MNNKTLTKNELDYFLGLNYSVTLYPDSDGGYVAEVKDLPGYLTQGDDAAEALKMIEDARKLWLETAYKHGDSPRQKSGIAVKQC